MSDNQKRLLAIKLLAAELTAKGLAFTKLTVRLPRDPGRPVWPLFVTVHGCKADYDDFSALQRFAKGYGFFITIL